MASRFYLLPPLLLQVQARELLSLAIRILVRTAAKGIGNSYTRYLVLKMSRLNRPSLDLVTDSVDNIHPK